MCTDAGACRVVLCDDAPDFLHLTRLLFERESHLRIVGEATDGEEAIDTCRELQPDVLLLDVSMPVMDGLTALPKVREVSPDTRVLMLSAFGTPAMKQQALENGAVGFIEKGENPLALPKQVSEHC
jgi:DNA-binding NarL/FixJ family response regulator